MFGICVGMQMLAKSSEEGNLPGLVWLNAEVKVFNNYVDNYELLIPHMGWNNITPRKENRLLVGFSNSSYFYFLHSYYFEAYDDTNIVSTTKYGNHFVSTINKENIYGVQFHPEVVHSLHGKELLSNFLFDISGCEPNWTPANFVADAIQAIKDKVGDKKVICGLPVR